MPKFIDQPSNQDLFHAALKRPPEERKAFLDKACETDPAQKEEVQSLLDAYGRAETFLNEEPLPMATAVFTPPKFINQYIITEKVNEGAMGIVFKAEDTILRRTIAIKFLKPEIYQSHQSVDRLKREAKALAAVNSPQIATIHDLIESEGICAIVLEYIEGESLRARLDRRPLAIDEAIQIAILISLGLKTAHEKGIVHRDLKPSNIILTHDKGVKILDFGLAKLEMAMTSIQETHAGTILGTTAYMSPEQTRGESASSKSDLWSLGCILFEMLAATHPFQASNTADTIANVLKSSPLWQSLPPDLPSPVFYLLRQCLLTAPESRPADASAVHFLLLASQEALNTAPISSVNQTSDKRKNTYWIYASCFIFAMIGLVAGLTLNPSDQGPGLRTDKKATGKPVKVPILLGTGSKMSRPKHFSISPDGSQLIYANVFGMWHQSLNSLEPARLLTRKTTQEAFWNPGCNAIAYLEGQTLVAYSIESNTRTVLIELPGPIVPNHGGGSWLTNNKIRFNTGDEGIKELTLHQYGTLHTLLDITDSDDNFHNVSSLPNGRGLLFSTHRRNDGIDTLSIWTPETQRKDILKLPGEMLDNPVYSNLGYILFCSLSPNSNLKSSKIWAFPFDLDKLEKTGPKFLIEEKGDTSLTISDSNTLVYGLADAEPIKQQLAWLGSSAIEAKYPERGFARDTILSFTISPNQSKVAFLTADETSVQLWVHNFESSTSYLVGAPPTIASLSSPLWKGEDHLIYTTWNSLGVTTWIQSARRQRATPPRKISPGMAIEVSRDGRQLIVQGLPRWGGHTIIQLDEPDAESKVLSESLGDLWAPKFSPSLKFIAFVAGEKRKNSSIYLTDYSTDSHSRFVVNKNLAGTQPFWHPTKDLLYFVHIKDTQSELYSVNVKSVPTIQLSLPNLEAVIPGSTNLGNPFNIHIMAYHEEKNRFLIIEDQITNKGDSTSRGNAVIIPEWRPRDLFKAPPKVLPQ